ncbi:MAG TPA: V-type ATP synthase subunit F [Atribacteraceae bacterium]|nr:V-type ATP synthase subunit F [Atribacteraceae bacterium]
MSERNTKLAFVGGEENALCFRGMGFDNYLTNSPEQLRDALPALRKMDYALIIVEWKYYSIVKSHFEDLKGEALPVVLGIPTRGPEAGKGGEYVRKLVEIAIGSDILL